MFDLIASNAVLEHVSDVSGFVFEVKRMLRPERYFYGLIHYPTLFQVGTA